MYYSVYVLFSTKDRQLYVGRTNDLGRRLREHFDGKVTATKHRLPLRFIYSETYLKFSDAARREKYLKGGNGRAGLKIQLQDILKELHYKNL
ncbi:MAG: GIY-YIG nuclease family protein [Patescibacteria group bacterium]